MSISPLWQTCSAFSRSAKYRNDEQEMWRESWTRDADPLVSLHRYPDTASESRGRRIYRASQLLPPGHGTSQEEVMFRPFKRKNATLISGSSNRRLLDATRLQGIHSVATSPHLTSLQWTSTATIHLSPSTSASAPGVLYVTITIDTTLLQRDIPISFL